LHNDRPTARIKFRVQLEHAAIRGIGIPVRHSA
jgi:hypothetical protein